MVVGVETEAGDSVGDDALTGEGYVVGALEELLLGVGVLDEVCTVSGELGAEGGALIAGEPKGSGGDGGVGTADHLELEVRDDIGERCGWCGQEGASAEAADLFGAEEGEDNGAFGAGAGGEDVGEGEDGGGAGGVVVGTVVDEIGFGFGGVGFCYAEVVEVGGEEDDLVLEFGVGAGEDGDGVPGLFAGRVFEAGEALLEAVGDGVGQRGFLEVGAGGAARFEAEGLELGGGE